MILAVSAETTSGILFKEGVSIVLTEKDEKGNAKAADTEKEESKDKLYQCFSLHQEFINARSFFVLSHIHFKYSAYLSLPEIPPEQI